MVYSWFHKTQLDECFYMEHIQGRLPQHIVDAHVHMNLQEHIIGVSPERIQQDWALECGLHMDYPAAQIYYGTIFHGKQVELVAFPFPLAEVDIPSNNSYLAGLMAQRKVSALMSVRPEWTPERCERDLLEGGFCGFKPYPYLASNEKGADISIYGFMPKAQLEILDRHQKALILHLPRKGRLPAPDNIRELLDIRQRYPGIKIVLAHFGRCFTPEMLQKGLDALGDDRQYFYYDTAAVIHPQVYNLALERLGVHRILFGTDFPIMIWHGMREWHSDAPTNFCRESFSWNNHQKGAEAEETFTYIAYVQMKNLLDLLAGDLVATENIFCNNAVKVFGLSL